MILTSIADIDYFAEQVLNQQNCFIRIDLNDYKALKESSASIKATTIKLTTIDDKGLSFLSESLSEFGNDEVKKVLLYIHGETTTNKTETITYEQVMSILTAIDTHFGKGNLIWGIADNINASNGVDIHIFVGY
jgi:hypothetical protein